MPINDWRFAVNKARKIINQFFGRAVCLKSRDLIFIKSFFNLYNSVKDKSFFNYLFNNLFYINVFIVLS